jgi:PAS domain S-box-containing protein
VALEINLLEGALNSLDERIALLTRDGRIVYLNTAAARDVRLAPDALSGRLVWEMDWPLSEPACRRAFERVASGGSPEIIEQVLAPGPRWVEVRIEAAKAAEPRVWMVARDISDCRRAERRFDVLAEASAAFTRAATDFQAGTRQVVRRVAEILGEECAIWVDATDGRGLEPIASTGAGSIALGEPAAEVFRTGRTFTVAPWAPDETAELWVPIQGHERVVGAMRLGRPGRYGPYAEDDRRLAEALAGRAAASLEAARLYEEARTEGAEKRAILESMTEAVILTDEDGFIFYNNAAAEALFGYERGELVGRHVSSLNVYPPDENRRFWERIIGELRTHGFWRGEFHNRRKDGGRFVTRARISALQLHGQRCWLSVQEDVTDQKRAEAGRRASDRRLRFLEAAGRLMMSASLDSAQTLLSLARLAVPDFADWCVVDLVDRGAPRRVAEVHRDPEKEPLLRELRERPLPSWAAVATVAAVVRDAQPWILQHLPTAPHPEPEDPRATELLLALGAVSILCVPIHGGSEPVGALTWVRAPGSDPYGDADLTLAVEVGRRAGVAIDHARLYESAKRARAEAEAANRLKDEFLATLSHELNTPLNAVLGWAEVLSDLNLDEPTRARAVEAIHRNATIQSRLISDILDVSRIVTGKLLLDVRPVVLADVIEAALDTVRPAARAKGHHLDFVLDPAAGAVYGDADRLQQVVWNLLSNAVKFTPNGGSIVVCLESGEAEVLIHVKDDGKGIPPAFLPYAFDPFRQADPSSSRRQSGLGIGLALVRHLVELHGGRVEAANRRDGRGAVFTVRLPRRTDVRTDAEALSRPTNGRPLPSSLQGLRLVVALRDEAALQELAAELGSAGAQVIAVRSAADALEAVGRERPHVIVADIDLPEVEGRSLLSQVRSLGFEEGGLTPAVAVVPGPGHVEHLRALHAGFQAQVAQPVDTAELARTVAALASLRR